MKRSLGIILFVVLAAGAGGATYWFLNSPHYSLYQIGRGVHNRDASLVLAYVDLDAVYRSQKDEMVDLFIGGENREAARQTIKNILTVFSAQIQQQLRSQAIKWIQDPGRDNLPTAWALPAAATVARRDDYALVVLNNPIEKQRLRLAMRRTDDQPWKVVEVNAHDLKKLIERHIK